MSKHMPKFLSAAVLFATAAYAQIGSPTLGYVPHGSSIAAVNGISASASIAAAIDVGRTLSQVTIAQDVALATDSSDGTLLAVIPSTNGQSAQVVAVSGASARPRHIYLSPNGSYAVSWLSARAGAQVIGSLSSSPAVIRSIDASYLGVDPLSLSISDDGEWVAGAWLQGVYAFGPNGEFETLPAAPGVTALAFFHGTHDLALTTSAFVAKISDVGGANTPSALFGSADAEPAYESPNALAISSDNRYLVLSEPDGGIGQIDFASGAVTVADCQCRPDGLFAMEGSVFRLNTASTGAMKVYDASSQQVLFVPLASSTAGGQQ